MLFTHFVGEATLRCLLPQYLLLLLLPSVPFSPPYHHRIAAPVSGSSARACECVLLVLCTTPVRVTMICSPVPPVDSLLDLKAPHALGFSCFVGRMYVRHRLSLIQRSLFISPIHASPSSSLLFFRSPYQTQHSLSMCLESSLVSMVSKKLWVLKMNYRYYKQWDAIS